MKGELELEVIYWEPLKGPWRREWRGAGHAQGPSSAPLLFHEIPSWVGLK